MFFHTSMSGTLQNGVNIMTLYTRLLSLQANDVEITKALLAFDANVNIFDGSHETPLDLASYHPGSQLNDILERLDGKTYAQLYEEEGMNFHMELKQAHNPPSAGYLATPIGQPLTPSEHTDGLTEGIVLSILSNVQGH